MLLGTLTIYGKLFFYISSKEPCKYIACRADSDPPKEDIPEELTLLRKKYGELRMIILFFTLFLILEVQGLDSNICLQGLSHILTFEPHS